MKSLPQTGGQLKSLHLGWNHLTTSRSLQLSQIKLIVNNCLNLEQHVLGMDIGLWDANNFGHVLSKKALNYLCENLTQTIFKLEKEDQPNVNDLCLRKVAKRFKNLKALDISGTQVTFDGLIANIDNLTSLEYLGIHP